VSAFLNMLKGGAAGSKKKSLKENKDIKTKRRYRTTRDNKFIMCSCSFSDNVILDAKENQINLFLCELRLFLVFNLNILVCFPRAKLYQ